MSTTCTLCQADSVKLRRFCTVLEADHHPNSLSRLLADLEHWLQAMSHAMRLRAICMSKQHRPSFPSSQVARRVRSRDRVADEGRGGKKRAVRYQCACLDKEVYLHPQSSLYSIAPEYVIYTQLIQSTKRPYMTGWRPSLS